MKSDKSIRTYAEHEVKRLRQHEKTAREMARDLTVKGVYSTAYLYTGMADAYADAAGHLEKILK